jgi:hypothetical protein
MTGLEKFTGLLSASENDGRQNLSTHHSGVVLVPDKTELENDCLVWNPSGKFSEKTPDKDLIVQFSNLALTESLGILRFARKWGVLGICVHGLPASHNSELPFTTQAECPPCTPSGSESIELWRRFARIARAMLSIATQLHNVRRGNENDWLVLLQGGAESNLPTDIATERRLLKDAVNLWLELGNVRPRLEWDFDVAIVLAYPLSSSLFGVLATQLPSFVARSEGLLTCASCGRSGTLSQLGITRFRRPRAGNRFFCDDCRDEKAPQRFASKAYKGREKAKK